MDWNQTLWQRSIAEFPAFLEPLVAQMGRRERREGAALYVQGLLMPGERKSIEPMAARLGTDSQKLQQFIADSPWDEQELWRAIRREVVPVMEPLVAWIVDETGWLKQGQRSVGVAHQYCGARPSTGRPIPLRRLGGGQAGQLPGERGGGGQRWGDGRAGGRAALFAAELDAGPGAPRGRRGARARGFSNQARAGRDAAQGGPGRRGDSGAGARR